MKNTNAKIESIMQKMTLREKLGQLNLLTAGGGVLTGSSVNSEVEEKISQGLVGGIFGMKYQDKILMTQRLAVETSRLGIPLFFAEDIIHGFRLPTFPLPLGMANSWDPVMVQETARIAARQASAEGINQAYSPMIDVTRDARWGRVAEGFGEDPYLVSQFAVAMVRGYQGDDLKSTETLMACPKHFAAYGASRGGLDYGQADMSPRELHETYLPPFEAAFDAGALSTMASFNDLNGIPSHANKELLTDLLRLKWGFLGIVVGDYTGVQELAGHGLGDFQEVAARALEAGLDLDMVDELYVRTIEKSLAEGRVTQDQIDTACRRILWVKDQMGILDDPYRYLDKARLESVMTLTPEFKIFSRQVAAKSLVLLNNADGVLPLKKAGTIGLIGPLADSRANMPGTWAVAANMNDCVTIREGLAAVAGEGVNFLYAKGANITDHKEYARRLNIHDGNNIEKCVIIDPRPADEMIGEAVSVAGQSDKVILVVGEAKEASGESSSVTNIALPENQIELIRAVMATGKPVALVVVSGRPMALENLLMTEKTLALGGEDENKEKIPGTILWMPFGGSEGGYGLADVVFGDVNPSGKLAMTFPRHVGQCPIHYGIKKSGRNIPATQEWEKFKLRSLDRKSTPLFEFGHGLSYTTFEYGPITFDKDHVNGEETLSAYTIVTNTGKREGEEIAQLYISDPVASRTRPVRELKAFQKILLQPGESRTLRFDINTGDLEFSIATCIADTTKIWEPGEFIIQIGPSSSRGESEKIFWDKPKTDKISTPHPS